MVPSITSVATDAEQDAGYEVMTGGDQSDGEDDGNCVDVIVTAFGTLPLINRRAMAR